MHWKSLTDHVSFGHDIEGSWLMLEAAEVLGDSALIERARDTGGPHGRRGIIAKAWTRMAASSTKRLTGVMVDPNKHWWAQAEAVVGFYNAYQISGEDRFRTASYRAWEYIEDKMVDRVHGEWHAKLKPDGDALEAKRMQTPAWWAHGNVRTTTAACVWKCERWVLNRFRRLRWRSGPAL